MVVTNSNELKRKRKRKKERKKKKIKKKKKKKKKRRGKCHSPVLLHGNIITCGDRRPSSIIMWTEGHGKI